MYDFTANSKGVTIWNDDTVEGEFSAADIMQLRDERNELRTAVINLEALLFDLIGDFPKGVNSNALAAARAYEGVR